MTKTLDVDNSSVWQCVQCGKTSKFSTNLKDHIEAHHLENLKIGCSICSKIFKSRGSLRFHMRSHKVWQVYTFCSQYNIDWLQRYWFFYYQELNLLFLDLEALVQSYLERSVDEVTGSHLWVCRQCGKTSAKLGNIKDHIEANHIEGLKLVCHLCMRSCKSSAGLRMHKARYHKDIL